MAQTSRYFSAQFTIDIKLLDRLNNEVTKFFVQKCKAVTLHQHTIPIPTPRPVL